METAAIPTVAAPFNKITTNVKSLNVSNAAIAPDLSLVLSGKFLQTSPEEIHLIADRASIDALRTMFKQAKTADAVAEPMVGSVMQVVVEDEYSVPPFIADEIIADIQQEMEAAGATIQEFQSAVRRKATEIISYGFYEQRCRTGFPGDQNSDWAYAEAFVSQMVAMYNPNV